MIYRYSHPSAKRQHRVRSRLTTSSARPRLSVFRSNQHTYAQIIDDQKQVTLVAASTHELKPKPKTKKLDAATQLGTLIATKALKQKINQVVFDRGQYQYHGRVKAVAEAARKAGLKI